MMSIFTNATSGARVYTCFTRGNLFGTEHRHIRSEEQDYSAAGGASGVCRFDFAVPYSLIKLCCSWRKHSL